MGKTNAQAVARQKRVKRIRKNISGTAEKPRMRVFKSAKHIYVQIIDDVAGQTLASISTLNSEVAAASIGNKTEQAKKIGTLIAEKAATCGISTVVFDRGGYIYHGRVKALADAAREAGLAF